MKLLSGAKYQLIIDVLLIFLKMIFSEIQYK